MKQYEYILVQIYDSGTYSIEKQLNDWGKKGWEFIYMRGDYFYIFKRELKKEEESL